MDPRVARLNTPEDCEAFAANASKRGRPDLAQEARMRAIDLRAEAHGAATDAEREALAAVYAYEEARSSGKRRRFRANRTWQMIERHGILAAVERAVNRPDETIGYTALVEMGLEKYAFEAIVLRYPGRFTKEAVARCAERIATWKGSGLYHSTRNE
ncbi:MAG: hypothetical protein JSR36_15365 [Proteobacteria bacterium]|nr:hypothetical protein [Pseudomonadota bacterium]